MGIDFTTGDLPYAEDLSFDQRAHWSYGGFNQFRERLGNTIGIKLRDMEGFQRDDIPGSGVGSWNRVNHPIVPLLDHSDCEGILTPEECKQVAPDLRKIIEPWSHDDYDRVNGLLLAAHMELCAQMGQNLVFC